MIWIDTMGKRMGEFVPRQTLLCLTTIDELKGKKTPFRVITNVLVMHFQRCDALSAHPAMATNLTLFLAIVLCDIGT